MSKETKLESSPGNYGKNVECPKCHTSFKVFVPHAEMLPLIKDYQCLECRGAYDKVKDSLRAERGREEARAQKENEAA